MIEPEFILYVYKQDYSDTYIAGIGTNFTDFGYSTSSPIVPIVIDEGTNVVVIPEFEYTLHAKFKDGTLIARNTIVDVIIASMYDLYPEEMSKYIDNTISQVIFGTTIFWTEDESASKD